MNRFGIFFLCALSTTAIAQDSTSPPADSLKIAELLNLGDSLMLNNQPVPAKKNFEQALGIAQANNYAYGIGSSYRSIGRWHEVLGDYNQAIAWYQKSLQAFKNNPNQKPYILTHQYIAYAYNRLNTISEARHYLMQGIALAQGKSNYETILQRLYAERANLESNSKQYDSASVYTQKVLDFYKTHPKNETYYTDLFNSALLYKNMGQYARSEKNFREVLAFAEKTKDDYLLGYVNASIPYALIPLNKLDEAEEACQKALVWAEKTGVDRYAIQEDINDHLSRLWEKRGDYRKALFFYKQRMASHDSLFNATKNRQVAELETRYQTREKEESINQLATTNARQTRQIWASAGGLVLLSLLLGMMYLLYRRVQVSRQKISQQSDQLTLMMKELHHRVKNNLAIVSSLLKLQSNRLDDEKAIQAVRVGQQRVEAMSLIHQRLYHTDQVTTVNMREYLADLAESLLHAYGYQPEDFDLQLNIEIKELDVDTAMPLGLIVNELATNAFKHAYNQTDGKRPLLRIDLHRQADSGQPGITLEVQDNGPGIDESEWQKQGRKASFGQRLIASLSEQLEGHFELFKQNGTLFRLRMPLAARSQD